MPTAMRRLNMAMRRHTAMRRYAATHEDGDVFQRLVSYRSLRTLELWAPRMETACDLDIHRKTRWGNSSADSPSEASHRRGQPPRPPVCRGLLQSEPFALGAWSTIVCCGTQMKNKTARPCSLLFLVAACCLLLVAACSLLFLAAAAATAPA